ncbi:amidinotransferase [Roseateles toxinivorans]|uniref:Amidinotransferase n=1 Tax=Roseateles toxinivorans TaxID=270368 RepID=A0A4R6QEP1_9BURK|nr:amidinotransferase [Roseateles toxinivorans]
MVLDHVERVAYPARSNRANAVALERFCTHFGFEPMAFGSADSAGREIYHTNVLMCIGSAFAIVGLDLIPEIRRRDEIAVRLRQSGRELIVLGEEQISELAGNAMELAGSAGPLLAISTRAKAALSNDQRAQLRHHATLLPLSVSSIELAGGSVRRMLAGVHLTRRTA